ncbi:MAG: ribonuclease HI family protein, partial [Candidatus Micrarchaeota archaeon]|nr:ribonuclease HI family protein [Candidatus Micrarchaeota archaeon]
IVYTDGASRGNPGQAAIAFMITKEDGTLILEKAERIGLDTNNVAEYKALIKALEFAKRYQYKEIICYSDSRLMINQLNGTFKIKKPHLERLKDLVMKNADSFETIEFRNVPRTDKNISRVDMLANMALDGRM